MLSIASRLYVQIGVVTRNADRLNGVFLMLARVQFLELIVDDLRNQVALLDPSFEIADVRTLANLRSRSSISTRSPFSTTRPPVVDRGDLIA